MAITLPYPDMDFTPLDVLTATEMGQIVSNYEAIGAAAMSNNDYRVDTYVLGNSSVIPDNTNLNTIQYLKVGKYYCQTWNSANTMQNIPEIQPFVMEVFSIRSNTYDNESTASNVYRLRKFTAYNGNQYVQEAHSSNAGNFTYGPWRSIISSSPQWSTFVVNSQADATKTFTSLKGNNYTAAVGSGGTAVRVSGAGNVNFFRQYVTAKFSSAITGNVAVHNVKNSSTVWSYWVGSANGTYANKLETHTADASYNFSDLVTAGGNKYTFSATITGTRMDNSNLWALHVQVQNSGSANQFTANVECEAKDANSLPTVYQRGATASNTSWCRNAIDILEE